MSLSPSPQTPDPAEGYLRSLKIPDNVKADAWDAFHGSANEDDLTGKLNKLPLPNEARARLWDLKYASSSAPQGQDLTAQNAVIDRMLQETGQDKPSWTAPTYRPGGAAAEFIERAARSGVDYLKSQIPSSVGQLAEQTVLNPMTPLGASYHAAKMAKQVKEEGIVPTLSTEAQSAIPFPVAKVAQQVGSGQYPEAVGTAATGAAELYAGGKLAEGTGIKGAPEIEDVPQRLVKGLGQTSANPEHSLATYKQVLPHLADVARDTEAAGEGHTAKAIFQRTKAKINDLGKPIRDTVNSHGDMPVGGDPQADAYIRKMVGEEIGQPNPVMQLNRPDMMKLDAIAQASGPLTLAEADTLRQYSQMKANSYHVAEQRGAPPNVIEKQMGDWQANEAYLKNVEYNKLNEITGLDIDQIQHDRSQLIQVNNAAMKTWARDLRQSPSNFAQSLGIPFGASRIIAGAISLSPLEIASGAAEVGTFAGYKDLMSNRHTLSSAMKDLSRSDLKTTDYRLPPILPAQPTAVPTSGAPQAQPGPIHPVLARLRAERAAAIAELRRRANLPPQTIPADWRSEPRPVIPGSNAGELGDFGLGEPQSPPNAPSGAGPAPTEAVPQKGVPDWIKEQRGNWFSADQRVADYYGPQTKAVDVPKEVAKATDESLPGKSVHVLPKEWAGKAKPVGELGSQPEGTVRLFRGEAQTEAAPAADVQPQPDPFKGSPHPVEETEHARQQEALHKIVMGEATQAEIDTFFKETHVTKAEMDKAGLPYKAREGK